MRSFFMSYVQGEDRGQAALLPAAIEDYVVADAPVRVLDAFVDGLDVRGLGFGRSVPAVIGRPPYDPRDLLKLIFMATLTKCARRAGWSASVLAMSRSCGFCAGWRLTSRRLRTFDATTVQRSWGPAEPLCCSVEIRAFSRRAWWRSTAPSFGQRQAPNAL